MGIGGMLGGAGLGFAIGGPVGAAIGAGAGAAGGSALGKKLYPEQTEVDQPPPTDPRLMDLTQRRYQLAQDFTKNAPGLEQQTYDLESDAAKLNLAEEKQGIRQDASRRGLLYSGIRKGQEADASAKTAGDLATKRMQIAQSVQAQQKQLEAEAFESGANLQNLEQQRYDSVYNARLAQAQAQAALSGTPAGIVGGLLQA